jgi:CMP-N-acetylneuraminic acid synthetase
MLIIIPIKKYSKRLKNKNFLNLINKPLFQWTVDFAKKNFNKKDILISTDCTKTALKLKQQGLQVPFIRPTRLAKSNSSTYQVVKHAIENYELNTKKKIKNLILLQPTSPFRSIKDLRLGIKLFNQNFLPTMSVNKLHVKSDKIYFLDKDKLIYNKTSKQNISYVPNGSFYIISKKKLLKLKNFYSKKMNFVEVSNHKNKIDIDYSEDLKLAKMLN